MAINETISTGNKYRRLKDASTKLWQRLSFWTKASDVEFDNGATAETSLGNIQGITDSVNSNASNIAASAAAVNTLNSNITSFQTGVDALYNQYVSLGVTPTGKTLAAITAAAKGLYAKGQEDSHPDVNTFKTSVIGMDQYGAHSGTTSFQSDGYVFIVGAIHNVRQVHSGYTATLHVQINGEQVAQAGSTSSDCGEGVGLGNFNTDWLRYTANSAIYAYVDGSIERMSAMVRIGFVPA